MLGRIASSRDPESPGLVEWWWCELFCMDKGDEDLDGPRSARICPFSKCDYTRIVLFFRPHREGFTNDFARLANLALLGCTRHGKSLPAFRRAPRVRSCYACTTHLSFSVDPVQVAWSYGHPFVPLFLFTPTASEANESHVLLHNAESSSPHS